MNFHGPSPKGVIAVFLRGNGVGVERFCVFGLISWAHRLRYYSIRAMRRSVHVSPLVEPRNFQQLRTASKRNGCLSLLGLVSLNLIQNEMLPRRYFGPSFRWGPCERLNSIKGTIAILRRKLGLRTLSIQNIQKSMIMRGLAFSPY